MTKTAHTHYVLSTAFLVALTCLIITGQTNSFAQPPVKPFPTQKVKHEPIDGKAMILQLPTPLPIQEIEYTRRAPANPPSLDSTLADGAPITFWSSIKKESCEDRVLDNWILLDDSNDGYERLWGCDDTRAAGGTLAAWPARAGADGLDPQTTNYPNNMAAWMIFGPVDFSNATDIEVIFDLWREIEPSNDYLFVGLSDDGQRFRGFFWDGNSDWDTKRINFKEYADKPSVWIGFAFISNYSVTYAGPWVDNINIRQYTGSNAYLYQEEAESAPLTGHMTIGANDNASACQYVYTPSYGSATYDFTVPQNGDYYLWARAMGLAWNQNSFWVSIDGGDLIHFEIAPVDNQWIWKWSRIIPTGQTSAKVFLQAGQHSLQFSGRETNSRLDLVLVTDSAAYIPDGVNTPCTTPTPTPPPTDADEYEPDNACAESGIIADGTVQTHNFHTPTDVDWVELPVQANHRYFLGTSNLASNSDTVLLLYQNDCNTFLMSNDDGGPGLGSLLTWNVFTDDTYYAKVRPYNDSSTGAESTYDLALHSQLIGPLVNQENIIFSVRQGYTSQVQLQVSNPTTETIHINVSDVDTSGNVFLSSRKADLLTPHILSASKDHFKSSSFTGNNRDHLPLKATNYRYNGPLNNYQVLVYNDDAYHRPGYTFLDQALRRLGLSYTSYYADCDGFQADLDAGGWDLLLVAHESNYCLGSLWDKIESYILSGSMAAISTFDIDGSDSTPTTLWNTLGITATADITDTSSSSIFLWSPNDSLFNVPQQIHDFSRLSDLYHDNGDRIATVGNSVAKAGFTEAYQDNQAAIVTFNGRVIVDSWITSAADGDENNNGLMDGVDLWMNQISYLTGISQQDAPWLDVTPHQETLLPGDQIIVVLRANTSDLAIGTYNANVLISHNGNVLNPVVVPVQLTVLNDSGPLHYIPIYMHSFKPGIVTSTPTPNLCDPFEPNDLPADAWGPLISGNMYSAKFCSGDTEDVYYFESPSNGNVTISINLPVTLNQHIGAWLYSAQDVETRLCGMGPIDTHLELSCPLPQAGRYLVRISSDGAYDSSHNYIVSITFP